MKKLFLPLVAASLLLVNCTKEEETSAAIAISPSKTTVLDEKALENLKQPYILSELSSKNARTTMAGTTYENLFQDNFNTTTLNTAIWNATERYKLKSGDYDIWWNKSGRTHYEMTGSTINLKISRVGTDISCGRIDTKGKKSFKYGYFEARIKFPTPAGYWGAFWSMPNLDDGSMIAGQNKPIVDNNVGTDGAEIDIAEANQPTSYSMGIHIDGYGTHKQAWSATKASVTNLYSAYHVYGMKWTDSNIYYYFDGNLVATMGKPSDWVPDVYQYAILNTDAAPGSTTWSGTFNPNASLSAVVMQVDWIKIHWN